MNFIVKRLGPARLMEAQAGQLIIAAPQPDPIGPGALGLWPADFSMLSEFI
jgi:hypothetical protein